MGENEQEAFARLLHPAVSTREKTPNKTGSLGWGYKSSFSLKKKPSKRNTGNSLYLSMSGMFFLAGSSASSEPLWVLGSGCSAQL